MTHQAHQPRKLSKQHRAKTHTNAVLSVKSRLLSQQWQDVTPLSMQSTGAAASTYV
jgi:hypothetical protein